MLGIGTDITLGKGRRLKMQNESSVQVVRIIRTKMLPVTSLRRALNNLFAGRAKRFLNIRKCSNGRAFLAGRITTNHPRNIEVLHVCRSQFAA